ncbi:MAG TPA: phosphatase PAP2 family protein [bacterium]|nr:phosphatase PAP2 family protein [bacterium]
MIYIQNGTPDLQAGSEVDSAELGKLERIDRAATLFLYEKTANPVFEYVMPVFSLAMNRGFIHIAGGTLMLILGGPQIRNAGITMLAASGAAGTLAEIAIKRFWKRKRPFMVVEKIKPKVPFRRLMRKPSFPSGHSAAYLASAVSLSICFPSWAGVFMTAGVLGAFSRIYNGVHFLSDVLAGSAIGIFFGLLITGPLMALLS